MCWNPLGAGRNGAVPPSKLVCRSVCLINLHLPFLSFVTLSCLQMLNILIYLALWSAVGIHSVIICSPGKGINYLQPRCVLSQTPWPQDICAFDLNPHGGNAVSYLCNDFVPGG